MQTERYTNSIFEHSWWLDIVAPDSWKEVLVKDNNGNVIARMPYVIRKKSVIMPQKTQTLGIWFSPSVENDFDKIKEIIYTLDETLGQYKYVNIQLNPKCKYVLPFRWKGYTVETTFTYRINDLKNTDQLYRKLGKSTKKNIRYAENRVEIESSRNFDNMWDLLQKTYALQGRSYKVSKELSRHLFDECLKRENGIYLEAKDREGNVHSCGFFVYDENVFYYLTGARDPAFSKSQSQILLLWEAVRMASYKSKVFDFEGSVVEGIEAFFRKLGGGVNHIMLSEKNLCTVLF